MHSHRAARRRWKWACTGVAAACLVGFGLSLILAAAWIGRSNQWEVGIANGSIGTIWVGPPDSPPLGGTGFQYQVMRLGERRMYWWPDISRDPVYGFVIIPLWIPFLLTSIPAAWLWRSDRRAARLAARGACPACGYDRAGLASAAAPCPECGAPPRG